MINSLFVLSLILANSINLCKKRNNGGNLELETNVKQSTSNEIEAYILYNSLYI